MIKSTLLRALGNPPKSNRRRSMRRRRTIERMEDRCVLASVSGTVIHDLDGDGVDPNDPGMGGVPVFIDANANGELDLVGTVVEPDTFVENDAIVQAGMTFSLVDENNTIQENVEILARVPTSGFASTGDLVFGTDQLTHFAFEQRLRVDFDTPVSSVAIDFISDRVGGLQGTLEVYDSNMQLLGSAYITQELVNGEYETMRLARAEGDIATFVASSLRPGITGRLDALRINDAGSEISTLTNSDGEYQIQNLPAGEHRVTQVVPEDFVQSIPDNGQAHDVTLADDEDATAVDFVNTPVVASWHNADNPLDVDGDGNVVPFDALLIINELNEPEYSDENTGELPIPPPNPVPAFFDVTNDGFVAPNDVLEIVNFLNGVGNAIAEGEPIHLSSSSPLAVDVDVDEPAILGDLTTSVDSETITVIDLSVDAEPIDQYVEVIPLDELEKVFDADEHGGTALDTSMVTEIDVDDAILFLLARDLLS